MVESADGLPDHLLRWLESAQRRVGELLAAELPPRARGVGPRRLRILQLIPPGGCSQQELAERALVTKQAMAGLLDALEADGLVSRSSDPADRRAWRIRRTRSGEAVSRQLDTAMERVEAALAAELGAAPYAALRSGLRAVADGPQ